MNDQIAEQDQQVRQSAVRPVGGVARFAVGGLLLAGGAWVVRAGWELRLAAAGEPASGPPDQGGGDHRPLNALENGYHVVTALGEGVALVCAVLFLRWLWRVRDNARELTGLRPRYAGFWVYLGWILPIANLWIPRGLVADVHRTIAPDRRLPRSLNWWWALWLIGTLSGVGFVYRDDTDAVIARAYTEVWPLVVSDAAVVGAAVAGALMVRAVTSAQLERQRQPVMGGGAEEG
ncbi:DUF4328 domain-containing protein [Streptomyces sp. NPDC006739]|uniref:DUF4328 domain-containing protein n=1 Tax=Streptomyces sp. NPDC006739 TaxID=3364763 RepID=UPI00369D73DD